MECLTTIGDRQYHLEFGPPAFDWTFDRGLKGEKVLILSWVRESQFRNIIFLRLITLRLRWPFFTHVAAVTNRDDLGEEE